MANRAYLYSRDCGDCSDIEYWDAPSNEEIIYYDSRHNIPFAWFFFFKPEDLKTVTVSYGASVWQEVKFFADKSQALSNFGQRRQLLLGTMQPQSEAASLLQELINDVTRWDGDCLLLDPAEIFGGMREDDAENFRHCTNILQQLEIGSSSAQDIIRVIGHYSSFSADDKQELRVRSIGYTYDY